MLDAENPAETTGSSESTEAGTAPDSAAAESAAPQGADEAVPTAKKTAAKRATAKRTTKKAAAKKTTAKRATKKAAADQPGEPLFGAEPAEDRSAAVEAAEAAEASATEAGAVPGTTDAVEAAPAAKRAAKKTTARKTTAKRTTKKAAAAAEPRVEGAEAAPGAAREAASAEATAPETEPAGTEAAAEAPGGTTPPPATALLFQPPDPTKAVVTTRRRRAAKTTAAEPATAEAPAGGEGAEDKPTKKPAAKRTAKKAAARPEEAEETAPDAETETEAGPAGEDEQGGERRRRRRGGRRRRRSGGGEENESEATESAEEEQGPGEEAGEESEEGAGTSRRRRRRRRTGEGDGEEPRARKSRNAEDEITALSGSTRLEAKKQRRREGREAGRRRAPIVSEAEFLARRESVDRVMVIRQRADLTQIAVLEDDVLVEHYVSRESQNSLIGNVYLGRVQNVLPSMEAAFIDIGKGRNAVLYAGEVNWDALGAKNGTPRKIEAVLKSGQPILVQVTKDPVGHKGARLTSQISLPGRFLVYVPDGNTSGISRKLPDTERNRLKNLLKEIVPESAGVIVRTAAEGASEEELTRDVERLTARWEDIERKVKAGNAPQLLYGEPDLTLKVVRDLFTEDFKKLVIAGDDAWDMVEGYVQHVAPDLEDRLERYDGQRDVFAEYRIDEQIEKALDRKVWLPSGGSLVIDRTEAMTVVDVNTGKFTGSGGNLEETVTKNNLEAAEEIVRQLRLRDIGGIIVVDFIDMVLESNRDLVLRRMVECLGRDRTRHQVAEVTSLGLVQMTRKRIGTGLLEAFSESCDHCQGRGLNLHHEPIEPKKKSDEEPRRGRRTTRGRARDEGGQGPSGTNGGGVPSPKDIAAMARHEEASEERAERPEDAAEQKGGPEPAERVEATERAELTGRGDGEAGAETTGPAVAAETKPSGRSRGGRGRGRGKGSKETVGEPPREAAAGHSEAPSTAEAGVPRAATEATPEAAPPEAAPPEEQTAQAEPTPPAAPKIVTTVRRRGARRAAGPPPGAPGAPSATASSAAGVAVDEVADQVSDEPSDSEPIAALVDSAELDGSDGGGAEVQALATPHVPVKKRGSRRR